MKKRLIYATLLSLLFVFNLSAQEKKHVASLSIGYGISFENSIHINYDDPDYEIWPDNKGNLFYTLSYEYRLSALFRVGARIEFEKAKYDSYYTGESSASRFVIGIHWLGQYPQTPLHLQLGGYGNMGWLNSDDFDNSTNGIEYGIMIGPGYEYENYCVALHFQPGFLYYYSKSDSPDDLLIMYPRMLLKFSYAFH